MARWLTNVLVATVVLALLLGLAASVIPAARAARSDPAEVLRD